MSDSNDMLEVLQADVAAILAATPALADAVVLADNEGDIEAKVTRALGTLTGTKKGLCVVVLLPEVTTSETNLPGPPVMVEVEIQTIEAVTINRATGGTGLRSSQAALITLNALHHQVLGSRALYADKDPITPVKVKPGFVSHAVKLLTRASGLQGPGKASAVEAAVTSVTAVANYAETDFAGDLDNDIRFQQVDSGTPPSIQLNSSGTGSHRITVTGRAVVLTLRTMLGESYATPSTVASLLAAHPVASTMIMAMAKPGQTGTGSVGAPNYGPVTLSGGVTGGDFLNLTCATAGASIYYTTDGSYPAAANTHVTLYAAPITLPAAGTMVRAAAYKTALNPGDCAEILITD